MSNCRCGDTCSSSKPKKLKDVSESDHHMRDPEMVEKAVRARLAMELDNKISEYEFLSRGSENQDFILAAHAYRVARSVVLNHGVPRSERVEDRGSEEGYLDLGEI